jgi:acetylornithine deacetylase/succinyl-diaminopimelate desuccinylase-like protein
MWCPDRVSFTIDRRTNPEEDFEVERAALLEIVEQARARGIDCGVEITQEGRSAFTGRRRSARCGVGRKHPAGDTQEPTVRIVSGVLETRHYAALGIPALGYGPGLLSVAHGPHEFVSVRKLTQAAEVYALTAASLIG